MVLIKNCIRNLEIKDKIIQRHYTMLKNLLKHFSKKKEDAGCDVYHKGVKVRHYDKVMVSDIPEIQNWAATLR